MKKREEGERNSTLVMLKQPDRVDNTTPVTIYAIVVDHGNMIVSKVFCII